jgi:hypothetical protein
MNDKRVISNFVENSQRYSQVKVHPQYQRPVANFATSFAGVVDTGGKFATGVNDAGDKLPPVSMTLVANLPPVSTTPVANNGNNIRLLTT